MHTQIAIPLLTLITVAQLTWMSTKWVSLHLMQATRDKIDRIITPLYSKIFRMAIKILQIIWILTQSKLT